MSSRRSLEGATVKSNVGSSFAARSARRAEPDRGTSRILKDSGMVHCALTSGEENVGMLMMCDDAGAGADFGVLVQMPSPLCDADEDVLPEEPFCELAVPLFLLDPLPDRVLVPLELTLLAESAAPRVRLMFLGDRRRPDAALLSASLTPSLGCPVRVLPPCFDPPLLPPAVEALLLRRVERGRVAARDVAAPADTVSVL